MKKLKTHQILFLLTQDIESPSGLGRYFPWAKNLVKHGLSVTITALHPNYGTLDKDTFWKENVRVNYVSQMHVRKENNRTYYFRLPKLLWLSGKAIIKQLISIFQNSPNIIVIGKPHPMNSISGLLGGFLVGAKIILDCDDYEAVSNYFSGTWQRLIVKTFENLMPKLVHTVTTNTIFNFNRMVSIGVPAKKIIYLPNGVEPERFQVNNDTMKQQIKNDLQLRDELIIAYIGSLSLDNHPVDLLLHAFKIVSETISDVKLMIVGSGKDYDHLQRLAKDLRVIRNVFFVGRVSPDLVPYYYQLTDVSVDPVNNTDAAKGRCPLKMFESWVMNTPFVTSDVGDRRLLANNNNSVLLAEPGNSEDLAVKLIEVLDNALKADLMCKAGRKRVRNFYWQQIVHENFDIFHISQ